MQPKFARYHLQIRELTGFDRTKRSDQALVNLLEKLLTESAASTHRWPAIANYDLVLC
jgi:hypothetical protein